MHPNLPRVLLFASLVFSIIFFLIFRERYLAGHDPANFVLSLLYGYDLNSMRPHAPGYPGFYVLWSGIRAISGLSPHGTILITNLCFTLIAITFGFVTAKKIFDEKTALLAALLIATNPLTIYYSSVSEIYAYDAAFSGFVVYLLLASPKRWEFILYFFYGLLGAFRLSSFILTAPVVILFLVFRGRHSKEWRRYSSLAAMTVFGTAAWLVPFIMAIGGLETFRILMRDAGAFSGSLAQNLGIFIPYMVWMVNISIIFILLESKRAIRSLRVERNAILAMLIAVPMFFFAFFCYSKGYALLYIVPLAMIIARIVARRRNTAPLASALIVANLLIVFAVPFITPRVESALNHAHRSSSERWQSAANRGTSFFSPTLAHIQSSDRAMQSALDLLSKVPSHSTVIIDNAASQYAYPRSLQAFFPDLTFVMPRLTDTTSLTYYHRDQIGEIAYTQLSSDSVFYLTLSALSSVIGAPYGTLMESSNSLELYKIPSEERGALMLRLQTFFARETGQ